MTYGSISAQVFLMSKTELGASRTLLSFCKARGFHS